MRKISNVYIIAFLTGFNLTSILLALPLYSIDKFRASSYQLGILGFLLNFLYSANTFITGKTFIKEKRNSLIRFSLIFITFLFPIFLILPSFNTVVILFGIYGLLQAWVWPILQAFLSEVEERNLPRVLGTYNIAWSTGNIFGTALAGKLYQIKFSLPFFLITFLSLISFLSIKGITIQNSVVKFKKIKGTFHPYYLKISRIFNFLNFMLLGAIIFLFPKLGKAYNFSPSLIGFTLSAFFGGRLIFFILWRFLTFWKYKFSILFLMPIISILSILPLGFTKEPVFFISGFIFLALSSSLTYSSSLLATLDRKATGSVTSEINESIIGAGLFSGPLVGGIISRYLSLPKTFLSFIPLLILGEIIGGVLHQANKRDKNSKNYGAE